MTRKKLKFEDVFQFPLTKHKEFYRVALEGLRRAEAFKQLHDRRQRKKELTDVDTEYLGRMNGLIELASMVSVVFSALALEAFINHYASQRLSKSYFENYLDKLDLVSKWLVIPRLIHGNQLESGSRAMNSPRWLVALRNSLVHYKSKVRKISELDWRKDWVNIEDAVRSGDTVPILIHELKKLDKKVGIEWLARDYDSWSPQDAANERPGSEAGLLWC